MKFLIVFASALALCTASAFRTPNSKLGITFGKKAAVGEFPYQVGIFVDRGHNKDDWCGGSLIGKEWVLTAAHCQAGLKSVIVYLGGTERGNCAEITYTISSSDMIIHAGWNSETFENDISLIRIPATDYTDNIKAIKLPAISSSYSSYVGIKTIVSGWGFVSDSTTSFAKDLQWAPMEVITNESCAGTFGSDITSSNLCVSTPGGVSPCHGDSGGPLVLESKTVQIGVISYGVSAGCTKGYPEVFTRVTSYLVWIKDKTGISY